MTKKDKIETKTEINKEARPFFIKKKGILICLIHGFTDSLYKFVNVVEILKKYDFSIKGIRLPGHGTCPDDLVKTNASDWYKEVEKEILELKKTYKDIYLIGFSFGGNLALKLSSEYPKLIKGVVCVESPSRIHYQSTIRFFMPWVKPWKKYWFKVYLKKDRRLCKKFADWGFYNKLPLKNIEQVLDFFDDQVNFLPKVKTPVLLFQSKNSRLVTHDSAERIYDLLNSDSKEIFWIGDANHSIIKKRDSRIVIAEMIQFFGMNGKKKG